MGCSALLYGRFDDSQEKRFQASKCSSMGTAILQVRCSVDFPNSLFKVQYVQIWTESKCKGVFLLIVRNGIFIKLNFCIRSIPSAKTVDLLIHRSSVFNVRNVEIWSGQSSN